MRRTFLFLILFLLPSTVHSLQVTSVSPSEAAPGDRVALTGGPFTPATRVRLGEMPIRPETAERDRLVFVIPPLPPGDYLLHVVEGSQGEPRRIFTLRIHAPTPRISSLSPPTVDSCRIQQGIRISVTGAFPAGTRLLLNGAVIAAGGDTAISFLAPPLRPGVHQVEAVGPDGRRSLPYPLIVEGVPRIDGIAQGADNVTSYELILHGENFLYTSTLVVDSVPVNLPLTVEGGGISAQPQTLLPRADSVRYIDCNTLVYIRHPYSREPKNVTLQVINPGGVQSPVMQVTIP